MHAVQIPKKNIISCIAKKQGGTVKNIVVACARPAETANLSLLLNTSNCIVVYGGRDSASPAVKKGNNMNTEICKECKYYRAYYHGGTKISYLCLWTLKKPKTIEKCIAHNLQVYDNLLKLFCDHFPEVVKQIDDDTRISLDSINDYENILYYVIDGKTVVVLDSISGDVINKYTLQSFYTETIETIE